MDEGQLVEGMAKVTAGGFSLGTGLYIARWLLNWLTGRADRIATVNDQQRAELDQSWKGYRLTLEARLEKSDERIDRLEKEVEDCHSSKRETEAQLARLQAYVDGEGQARQTGAAVAAYDRLIDRQRSES
jgi:predicted  nucleic acid-binding Zn-ribbon protein